MTTLQALNQLGQKRLNEIGQTDKILYIDISPYALLALFWAIVTSFSLGVPCQNISEIVCLNAGIVGAILLLVVSLRNLYWIHFTNGANIIEGINTGNWYFYEISKFLQSFPDLSLERYFKLLERNKEFKNLKEEKQKANTLLKMQKALTPEILEDQEGEISLTEAPPLEDLKENLKALNQQELEQVNLKIARIVEARKKTATELAKL